MPAEVAAAAPAAGGQQQQPPAPGAGILGTVARMVFMWWLMSWFKGGANNKAAMSKDPQNFSLAKFQKADLVDMYVFLNEDETGRYDMADLIWSETGIKLAVPDNRNISFNYELSPAVQNNGSVYLHAIFARAGMPVDPSEPTFQEDAVYGRTFNLVTYRAKPKNDTGVNLLSGDKVVVEETKSTGPEEIISFFKPNLTIQTVDHFMSYPKNQIPPQIVSSMQFARDGSHFPIIYFNDFWLLKDHQLRVNDTLTNVTLHLDYSYVSLTWWQLQLQMEQTFNMQRNMGLQHDGESDEIKRVFIEGNPYLLGLTMVVSLLHTVFDMLAFKNDIGFWKNNKSMEGLSARSVLINAGCQLVILLYLLDNETSYVVLISSFLGTGIEFWKVTKAMNVMVHNKFPFIKIEDRATYSETSTKKYDEDATRYLSYVLYPLVLGYAGYSLMYKTHKSWYSWILNSLVGAVYMFGFILMCPQLYLNYKLKSVAHLPWRQMTYKFLNTIIDDLFAFVIKMPFLHRLSVFRDDLIFVIYLYQRWIYRVDMKRVNEFGWAGEAEAEAVNAPATAALEGAAGSEPSADESKARRKDAQAVKAAQEGKAAADDQATTTGEDSKKAA